MSRPCVSTLRSHVVLPVVALLAVGVAGAQVPGPNVNMVSGTGWPGGDPFLQRQNEPSIAVSTRNPMHLLAGANDYRTVDLPGFTDDKLTGDAWLGVFTSSDGGATWRSTLIPGYPQEQGSTSPLHGFDAGADPVVRAGPHGLFYYSGIVFDRTNPVLEARRRPGSGAAAGVGSATSAVFVARYIDNNVKENGEPIAHLGTTVVASNTDPNLFLDKPWLSVDMPRLGAGTCQITQTLGEKTVTQSIPAGNAYLVYSQFTGSVSQGTAQGTLMFSRSTNCGATWSTPVAISGTHHISQGATIAIDSRTGTVYVLWRRFAWPQAPATPTQRDAILIARSLDRGRTFAAPEVVTEFTPFDQGTGTYQFRSSAYPTAGVDRLGRVLVAYSARGVQRPDGDARILLTWARYPSRLRALFTDEDDGTETARAGDARPTWTKPAPVDSNTTRRGHQLMPSMLVTGVRVQVAWVDLQEDHTWGEYTPHPVTGQWLEERVASAERLDPSSTVFNPARISDVDVHTRRHSADVWIAQANPGDRLTFTTRRASSYRAGTRPENNPKIEQLQFNAPNLPLFKKGTASFWGDYIDLGTQPLEQKLPLRWRQALQPDAAYVVFTDNRDVRAPVDGHWELYTPPQSAALDPNGTFEPGSAPDPCDPMHPEHAGMRNQNIYAARITQGLFVGSPGNAKPLGRTLQRAFVVYAENATYQEKTFRLSIPAQPTGGAASFKQFSPLTQIDLTIGPRSTASRTVYVTASDPRASVKVEVKETSGGVIVPVLSGGLQSNVVLNPDMINPDMINPDMINPDMINPDVLSAEVYTPDMINPDMINPDMINPDMINPDMINPDMINPDMINPDMINPGATSADVIDADILNPDMINPDMINSNMINGSLSDTVWTITNNGNTTAAYDVRLLLSSTIPTGFKTQLLLYKTYTTPVAKDCQLMQETQNVLIASIPNPQFGKPGDSAIFDPADGSLNHTTLWLAPGESAKVTLRVLDPDKTDSVTFDALKSVTVAGGSQGVDTDDAAAGVRVPQTVTSPASPIPFAVSPSATPIGGYVTPAVEVLVKDESGAVVPGATVTLALDSNPGGATLHGGSAVTDGAGIAHFAQLWLDRVGTGYRLRATAPSGSSEASGPFDVVPLLVTTVGNAGPGTLRQAMENANRNAGYADSISFDIAGGGVHTIVLTSALPAIVDTVTIDAATQPGYAGAPLVEIDGATVAADGLDVGPDAPGSLIRGLSVYGFSGSSAVNLSRPGGSVVEACYLGLDAAGNAHGNAHGVWIGGQSDGNRVGGTGPAARNVIGGNTSYGVLIDGGSDNVISGNHIGTDPSGSAARPNGQGVVLRQMSAPRLTADNVIGGTIPGEGNVISGNTGAGIALQSLAGLAPTGTLISGNTIGLDAAGVADLGNAPGIQVSGPNTRIISNVISGNGLPGGISLTGLADGAVIQGNKIGTDAAGGSALPNEPYGIHISGASISSVTVGGAVAGQGNLVSGNIYAGVYVMLQAHGVVIQGNRIGTDVSGARSLGEQEWGVRVTDEAYGVTVGGTTLLAGNLVSGNVAVGVGLDNTHDNLVVGNRIGTNAGGTASVPNRGDAGVLVADSTGDRIGTGDPGASNLISGNTLSGIELYGGVSNLRVAGNLIGTNASGLSAIPNTYGIAVYSTTAVNTVGGVAPSERNVISGNSSDGIYLIGARQFSILGNYIGTDEAGLLAVPNTGHGVFVTGAAASGITIGGNLLSGNTGNGLRIESSAHHVTVSGNKIGTNLTGTAARPNGGDGVSVDMSAHDVVVGAGNLVSGNGGCGITSAGGETQISGNKIGTNLAGTAALGNAQGGLCLGGDGITVRDNLISGNLGNGIWTAWATMMTIAANRVGTDETGTSGVPNQLNGIYAFGAGISLIGGATAAEGNTIAFNLGAGIAYPGYISGGSAFASNRIFSNGGLGIDLGDDGVTLNHSDIDPGPSHFLNFPVLTSAVDSGGSTSVVGTLDTDVPDTTLVLQFFSNASCDPLGHGEGERFEGEVSVLTNGAGDASFTATLSGGLVARALSATTVTSFGVGGKTSEFSACRIVGP